MSKDWIVGHLEDGYNFRAYKSEPLTTAVKRVVEAVRKHRFHVNSDGYLNCSVEDCVQCQALAALEQAEKVG